MDKAHSVLQALQARLLFPVYQRWCGSSSSCCPGGTVLLPSGSRSRARLASAEPTEALEDEEAQRSGTLSCVCDCTSECVFGRLVLRLSGAVTEAPWRLARQPSGQVIHTDANVIALTTNEHLVAMELALLHDTQSV